MNMPRSQYLRPAALALMAALTASAWAQNVQPAPAPDQQTMLDAMRDLQSEIQELRDQLQQLRQDAARSHADAEDLRRQLEATRAQLSQLSAPSPQSATAEAAPSPGQPPADAMARLHQDVQLLSEKVGQQYQTKVESASKYRVRFSGLALLNLFGNSNGVDNIENPTLALPGSDYNSSIGGTLRQTQLGFEAFGPTLAGARTRAEIQMDFAGGFAPVPGGISMGLLRLRTATANLDWSNTSIVAGQDRLFFSPQAPTSFASLEVPPLAYAGNLWAWTPQVRVEQRISAPGNSTITLAGGILDPTSGEVPPADYVRLPQPGERTGQPALAAHAAWSRAIFGRTLSLGAGGYRSRQDWLDGRLVTAWAVTSDWNLPLLHFLELSGSFYRGSSLGGLGGGIGTSVVYDRPTLLNPAARVEGLDALGGWAQLKWTPAPKWELNAAAGQDNPYAAQLRLFRWNDNYLETALARNRAGFVNVIYRPRSDLLFSAEFRRLVSYPVQALPESANHINFGMGVLF